MSNQKGSSRLDAALKMLLIAFISLLAFSSGVYFGKQFAETDYQLKALESDFKEQSKMAEGAPDGAKGEERPSDALVDEDVATASEKLMKEARANDGAAHEAKKESRTVASEKPEAGAHDAEAKSRDAKEQTVTKEIGSRGDKREMAEPKEAKEPSRETKRAIARHEREHESKKSNEAPSAVSKAAERVAKDAPPTEAPKAKVEKKESGGLPSSIGSPKDGEFTVQVASYPEPAEAKSHAAELIKKGYPAYPVEATVKGKTWYRVSVGSFRTMKEAGVYRAQLMKQADLRSAIVQKIER